MSDIFVSYASVDRERAQELADALTRHGWSVWWDRTIPPGRTFDEVIEEALDVAQCVIVLWSKASVASKWVRTEAAEGDRRGILVPVLLEDVKIPLEFRRIQAARITDWGGDESDGEFTKLCASIAATMRAAASEGPGSRRPATEDGPRAPFALSPGRRWWRRPLKMVALAALAIAVSVGGYKYWSDYREAALQAERRLKAEEEARRTEEARKVEEARRAEEERARRVAEAEREKKRRADAEQQAEAERKAAAERSAREAEEARRATAAREAAARQALEAARSTSGPVRLAPEPARLMPGSDTATISAISPLPGTALPRLSSAGPPMLFRMTVRYRLTSADRAILAVYVDEFPDTPGRCLGSTHRTQASELAPIGRGEGEVTVVVGTHAAASSGYLAPGMNIWPDSGGRPGSPVIRAFGVQSALCYRFGGARRRRRLLPAHSGASRRLTEACRMSSLPHLADL